MKALMRGLSATLTYPMAEWYSGRSIADKRFVVETWQREAPMQKRARAHQSLCSTIEYAGRNVPYYRDLFKRIRFEPSKLCTDLRYLQDIPFLTKETILAQPERFLSDQFDRRDLIERKTSGSTGLTLSFYFSQTDLDWASATIFRMNSSLGRDLTDREVHLSFLDPTAEPPGFRERLMQYLRSIAMNRKVVQIRELSAQAARHHLEEIRVEKAYLLYGLPSTLRALLILSESPELYMGLAKFFVSSGETLDEPSARFITGATGAIVVNRYGNAEFGAVAQSDKDYSRLEFVDGLAWPENLSIQGFPEIVLTTLVNRAMPLIRYRTGDLGLVESAAGGGFTLSRLQGRVHEIFMLDEHSYTTSFMSTFLHSRFRIHDFQIIQRETRVPEFRIVTDHPDELSGIEDALLSLCGVPVKATRIRTTDLLRRGRQMKFSHLVREDAKGTLGTDLK